MRDMSAAAAGGPGKPEVLHRSGYDLKENLRDFWPKVKSWL
jgi:hypothetical protein